jgi:hypothetical protein
MNLIEKCSILTGFYPSRAKNCCTRCYQWSWTIFAICFCLLSIPYIIFGEKNFVGLQNIALAVQSLVIVFRLCVPTVYFGMFENGYLALLDLSTDVSRWSGMLIAKSSKRNNVKVLLKKSILCFMYIPLAIGIITKLLNVLLPIIMSKFLVLDTKIIMEIKLNYLNESIKLNHGKTHESVASKYIAEFAFFSVLTLFINFMVLKQKCLDILIYKMYLQIINETKILKSTLEDNFQDNRLFFFKNNLMNWIKYKNSVVR